MVYDGLKGEAWHWFLAWRLKNFSATWNQFEIEFLHRYQSNFSSVLPELNSSTISELDSNAEEQSVFNFQLQQQQDESVSNSNQSQQQEEKSTKIQDQASMANPDSDTDVEIIDGEEAKAESYSNFNSELQQQQAEGNSTENSNEPTISNPKAEIQFQQQQFSSKNSKLIHEEEEETVIEDHFQGLDMRNSNDQTAASLELLSHAEVEAVVLGAVTEERMENTDLEPEDEAGAIRPPPAPPDLTLLADVMDAMTRVHSSVKDGAATEGKPSMFAAYDDGATMSVHRGLTVVDGGLRARLLCRTVLLKPPPLLAAIFPWDRGRERHSDGWKLRPSEEDSVEATVTGGVGRRLALEGRILVPAAARGSSSNVVSSLLSFGYSRKAGSLATAAAVTSEHPQSSGSRHSQGLAVVELSEAGWKHEVGGCFQGASLLVRSKNERGLLNPNLKLGFNCLFQAQFKSLYCSSRIGPEFIKHIGKIWWV
ncbi:hypothetical protein PIB30_041241 [Stylosanthes scabra]|uniref:Retrotransposon gag domain-containing protein n=1 Tax=Stylosanthes scabra TaxID=79078 RepID=A0ABU6TEL0_9FABA|nr:hypothetical protein [Stylosanthes scabra]